MRVLLDECVPRALRSQIDREEKVAAADTISPTVCHCASIAQLKVMGFGTLNPSYGLRGEMTRPQNISPPIWENAKREARDAMIATARSTKGMMTYRELTHQITSVPLEPDSEALRELLGEISTAEDAAGRGMLSVLVVHQGGDGRPGRGFFTLARRLGRNTRDRDGFWASEFARVREVWRREDAN